MPRGSTPVRALGAGSKLKNEMTVFRFEDLFRGDNIGKAENGTRAVRLVEHRHGALWGNGLR